MGLRDGSAVKIQVSQSYGMNFVSKQNNDSNNNKEGVGAITKQRKRSQEDAREGKVLAIQAVGLEFSSPEPRKRA